MRYLLSAFLAVSLILAGTSATLQAKDVKEKRIAKAERILKDAEVLLEDVMSDPESRIPQRIFEKAKAIAIFPGVIKAGFIWGGRFGEGVLISKDEKGNWKNPLFFTMTGGSFGLQIGAKSMDIVLFIMNDKGLKALVDEKVTIGGDLAVTAGVAGDVRAGDIDPLLKATIISYTRARGLFAGVSVKGSVIAYSHKLTDEFYGKEVSKRDVLLGKTTLPNPRKAEKLIALLVEYTQPAKKEKAKHEGSGHKEGSHSKED